MGGEATSASGGGGFRARFEHYLYSGEKKHVVAGIAIFAAIFGVPWYFMSRGCPFVIASRVLSAKGSLLSGDNDTWYVGGLVQGKMVQH
ncbi:hypothetical protein ABZP36_029352 [Zizania latifolia]